MARRRLIVPHPAGGSIALVAATAKTVLQIKANNVPVEVRDLEISFDGVSATDIPVLVELVRQTNGGTMTSANIFLADDGVTYTPNMTAQHTATVEPTEASPAKVVFSRLVHPQTGFEKKFDPGDVVVKEGAWLGLRVTAPANVNCIPNLRVDE